MFDGGAGGQHGQEPVRPTRSWYSQITLDRPEWAAEMLSALFEAARVHGTTVQVQAQPAGEGSPSGQAP